MVKQGQHFASCEFGGTKYKLAANSLRDSEIGMFMGHLDREFQLPFVCEESLGV
jgi:hypothetical protein